MQLSADTTDPVQAQRVLEVILEYRILLYIGVC